MHVLTLYFCSVNIIMFAFVNYSVVRLCPIHLFLPLSSLRGILDECEG